jgi:hypothetical protein
MRTRNPKEALRHPPKGDVLARLQVVGVESKNHWAL